MTLTVHDVGHGLCVSLIHENRNVMLWDCGRSDANRPSVFLPRHGISRIDRFFVTNYDEDHIADMPAVRAALSINELYRNRSISDTQLRLLKLLSGPISPAMESMLDMISTYTAGPPEPPPAFPGLQFTFFCNRYNEDFSDTNNISLVTFLTCNSVKFIIPGDLEKGGWERLLENTAFRAELAGVKIFIASHHGRESGYCRAVFDICHPDGFVFSDSSIKYATQEMANTYATHATGLILNGQKRRVLSTRKDGSLIWNL